MAPKRPASGKASGKEPKRVRKVMTLQQKVELLDMLKAGNSFAAVGRHFAVNESTVRSIQKEEVERMSTVRDQDVVRMESALALWIHDCRKKNVPLGHVFICEKARQLYAKFSNGSETEGSDVAQEADFLGFDEASDEEEPKAGPSSALQGFQASKGLQYGRDWPLLEEDAVTFIPQVKQYLSDLCMEFKVLLLMDNAGHPADLCYEGVQLEFLPANTTSLLQPMDQGVIRAFKALYTRNSLGHLVKAMDDDSEFTLKGFWRKFKIATCLNVIDRSLRDMKKETLNSCWKKLWPECVNDYKGFSPQEIQHLAIDNAVKLAKILGGEGFDDITKDEVGSLIDTHTELLTDQDLEEIIDSDIDDNEDSTGSGNEGDEDGGLTLDFLNNYIRLFEEAKETILERDPCVERALKFVNSIDGALSPYAHLLSTMKKQVQQLPITSYFSVAKKAPPAPEIPPEEEKGTSPEET
ncbi:tigger transposable element-derived protein 1-like [Macrobrachium nipponense]|uniref:tigger transposable element-derived protein 1-like n=1 Tax=Macrobrachium nipponense TaxID=159736 RepID=UPI0030C82643